jgi:hypothetical protein
LEDLLALLVFDEVFPLLSDFADFTLSDVFADFALFCDFADFALFCDLGNHSLHILMDFALLGELLVVFIV